MKILCLDFDGVIHSYTNGWKGTDIIPDPPVPGAIEFLIEACKHFTVCIFSSRSGQEGGIEAMMRWLLDHELPPETIMEISFPAKKPAAFLTIDDRAITFNGKWPSMEALDAFKTWQGK